MLIPGQLSGFDIESLLKTGVKYASAIKAGRKAGRKAYKRASGPGVQVTAQPAQIPAESMMTKFNAGIFGIPGPVIALGGAALIFLLTRKK